MRIVAGRWRGRRIDVPRGDAVRPTKDRVREALFSSLVSRLGPDLGADAVLDAFAGSGALGLEALSRGASSAVFIEQDAVARRVLEANVATLGASREARVIAADALTLAARGAVPGGPFALLLLDPPYRMEPARVRKLLEDLAEAGSLAEGALVVYEHDAGVPVEWPPGFEGVATRRYGSTGIDLAVLGGE